jgi:autotransporter-associated beta strand protein
MAKGETTMKITMRRVWLSLVMMSVAASVQALTYTWDGGGTTNNWSDGANWNPDGGVPVSASDTLVQLDGNVRTSQTQDIADPLVLNRLEFLNNAAPTPSFNLSGSAVQVVTNGDVQPYFYLTRTATCTMSNPIEIPAGTTLNMHFTTYGLTLSGVISGEGAIDKQDQDGGLTLDNGANSFSGGLTVRARDKDWCKVNVQASGAMGTGPVHLYGGTLATTFKDPGGLIFNNTTFQTNPISLFQDSPIFVGMTNSRTTSVTLNGELSLSTNVLHLRGGGSGTVNGAISGTGTKAIQKSDPGKWTLSGANAFTGRVTVSGGILKLGLPESLSPSVPLSVTAGTLDLNGYTVTNSGITLSGGAISNGSLYATAESSLSAGALLAPLSGPAGLAKTGAGTLTLAVSNAYQGATTVHAGTLQFAQRASLYSGDTAQWTDANLIVNSGATLAFNVGGAGEFSASDLDLFNALGSATGGFKSGSVWGIDTTSAPGGAFAYGAVIGDPGGNVRGLTKLGAGTLELTGLNTYTGPTRLDSGALSVNTLTNGGLSSSIGLSSSHKDNLIFAGGTLRYTGPSTRTDRGFKFAVSTNFYTFDVAQPNTVLTFGTIQNAIFDGNNTTIMKTGPGTLVFGKGPGTTYNFPVKSIYVMEGTFLTEAGNVVQHNLHCLASQGPAFVLGDGAVLGFSNPLENYVNGGEMMVQYVGTQSCARVTAGNWLLCGPTTNSVGDRLFNTHIFDVNDGADEIDLDISSQLNIYPTTPALANSHVRKTGAGTLRLKSSSSTFRGTTIIRNGRLLVSANVPYGGNSVLGNCTNDVVVGDLGTGPNDLPTFAFEGPANSAFTFARGIAACATGGAVSAIGCISNANCTFSGPITVSNTLQVLSVTSGTNAIFITGGIGGPGGVAKTGAGLVLLVAANTYTGATTVAAGTLRLAAAERIDNASPLRLTGGTFALLGFSETLGALDVDGAAAIDFGSGSSTLTLADSASQTWDGTLVLRNWTPGADHLFVGTSASLSQVQLKKIASPTGQPAAQLPSGEVVLLPLGTTLLVR